MRVRLKRDVLLDVLSQSGITQNHWAMRLGLSKGHLSEILNGKHPFLSPRTREKLLAGLGLSVDELFQVEAGDAWTYQSGADFQAAIHDRYVIDRELGHGGMGTVYLARDVKLGRPVAIKVLSPEAVSGIGTKQFLREIRYTTTLEHPNILTLLDADEAAGYPYYVMPFVRGGSLRDRLKVQGIFTLEEIAPILRDVASALDAAHTGRIIHCDVKPANILLAHDHAYLADFGISRTVQFEARAWGKRESIDSSAGTPAYVSPEQVAGDDVDGRADMYSLGCVAFEMLTGQQPFRGTSTMEIVSRRFTKEIPRVDTFVPSTPIEISRLVEQCMSLQPRLRPSASQFAQELDEVVRYRSVSHRAVRTLARWSRRGVARLVPKTWHVKKGRFAVILDQLLADFRLAGRSLGKRPGFTFVAVLTLGLGVGVNTALFSVVNGVLLQRPVALDADGLVEITRRAPNGEHSFVSRAEFDDLREFGTDVFADLLAYQSFTGRIAVDGAGADVVYGELVTGNYFTLLDINALVGRTFLEEEDGTPGPDPVAVLGYQYWRSRFEAEPGVVGTTIRLNGRAYTIVGVIGPDFQGKGPGFVPAVWVPLSMQVHLNPSSRDANNLGATALLRDGITAEEANGFIASLTERLDADRGRAERRYQLDVAALSDVLLFPGLDRVVKAVTMLLMGAVGLVLAITCANLAGFLLARGADRRKEIAVRLALGARRTTVVRQLMTETVLLALLGGVVGLVFASWTVPTLAGIVPVEVLPVTLDIAIDWRVMAFTFSVATLAGLLLGLAPAVQGTRPDLSQALRGSRTGDRAGARWGFGDLLVVIQMMISLVLLVGAGSFIRSFRHALGADLGF